MLSINVIDPNTGKAHAIPFDELPDALEAGGQFENETEKLKASMHQKNIANIERDQQSYKEGSNQGEQTGFKALLSDTLQHLGGALKNGVGFVRSIPEEAPAAFNMFGEKPLRAYEQVGSSVANLGKGIINAPHDLAKFLQKKGAPEYPIPGTKLDVTDLIPHIPEDLGIEKKLGLDKTEPGDRLLRASADIATLGLGAKNLVQGLKKPDLKSMIKDTQSKVNRERKESGQIFDDIEKVVEDKGINQVPIDKDLIEQAKSLLSKTLANKKLIAKAETGDYKSLRKLQADLRKKGEKALSSDSVAENDLGEEILDVRDNVNSAIEDHLVNTGNEDLAEALNQNRENYRNNQQTYFSSPALAKVFGKSQVVPKNPLTLLTEDSVEMNRFLKAHPEVKDAMAKALKHKRKMQGLGAATAIAGIGTTDALVNKFLRK